MFTLFIADKVDHPMRQVLGCRSQGEALSSNGLDVLVILVIVNLYSSTLLLGLAIRTRTTPSHMRLC